MIKAYDSDTRKTRPVIEGEKVIYDKNAPMLWRIMTSVEIEAVRDDNRVRFFRLPKEDPSAGHE